MGIFFKRFLVLLGLVSYSYSSEPIRIVLGKSSTSEIPQITTSQTVVICWYDNSRETPYGEMPYTWQTFPVPTRQIVENMYKQTVSDEQYKAALPKLSTTSLVSQIAILVEPDYGREFVHAWLPDIENPGHIIIDLTAAKKIQLSILREKRNLLLSHFDGLLLRAQEIGTSNEVNTIKKIRQELRESTEQLKKLSPANIHEIKQSVPDFSVYEQIANGDVALQNNQNNSSWIDWLFELPQTLIWR